MLVLDAARRLSLGSLSSLEFAWREARTKWVTGSNESFRPFSTAQARGITLVELTNLSGCGGMCFTGRPNVEANTACGDGLKKQFILRFSRIGDSSNVAGLIRQNRRFMRQRRTLTFPFEAGFQRPIVIDFGSLKPRVQGWKSKKSAGDTTWSKWELVQHILLTASSCVDHGSRRALPKFVAAASFSPRCPRVAIGNNSELETVANHEHFKTAVIKHDREPLSGCNK